MVQISKATYADVEILNARSTQYQIILDTLEANRGEWYNVPANGHSIEAFIAEADRRDWMLEIQEITGHPKGGVFIRRVR